MSQTDPTATTVGDLCTAALFESGWLGVGQVAAAEDMSAALARLQWMLQEWERQRWKVFHLVTLLHTSTGANSYTIGPGGNIDTGVGSVRPDKIEAAFLRQLTQSQPNQIDYPLEILQSMEDYSRIALKQLVSFPGAIFLDTGWPLGTVFTYPVPQANIYALGLVVKEQLPSSFVAGGLTTVLNLPYEYYSAILYNLALRLRNYFRIPTYAGDSLKALAKSSTNVLRGANTQIARLNMPTELVRGGIYNIFSDRTY